MGTHQFSTRLAAASDKVYQLLAHGRWFSPATPTSSTTKMGRHDSVGNDLGVISVFYANDVETV
jgi:hypothetical protein